MTALRAPFPWFGGKRRVADVVWRAFGARINNYVEPFAGSLAVLLGRPGGPGKIETVNDLDRYVSNFWRAVSADPEAVARHADWPVNEADMHARHKWLVNQVEFRERMLSDPDFFDAKIAGWWCWGLCVWIGGGWCAEPGNRKHPKLDGIGKGVHSNAAHPTESRGVHLPALGNDRGLNGVASRPCLDPPYAAELRDDGIYGEDAAGLSEQVRHWAIEHGEDPDLRIALCGYAGEHDMPASWTEYSWKAPRGYAAEGNDNREKERIWFSPHCLPLQQQGSLFLDKEVTSP